MKTNEAKHTPQAVQKCGRCGEPHSAAGLRVAEIFLSGEDYLQTSYGKKTRCGLSDLVDRETHAPDLLRQRDEARAAVALHSVVLRHG